MYVHFRFYLLILITFLEDHELAARLIFTYLREITELCFFCFLLVFGISLHSFSVGDAPDVSYRVITEHPGLWDSLKILCIFT